MAIVVDSHKLFRGAHDGMCTISIYSCDVGREQCQHERAIRVMTPRSEVVREQRVPEAARRLITGLYTAVF